MFVDLKIKGIEKWKMSIERLYRSLKKQGRLVKQRLFC
jgi:hypothetical protein